MMFDKAKMNSNKKGSSKLEHLSDPFSHSIYFVYSTNR